MDCRYCQAANSDDDHRCRRCGRRLGPNLTLAEPLYTGSSAAAPVIHNRTAPVLQAVETRPAAHRAEPHRSPEPSAPRRPVTYQPSLFTSRELPLVVPFETIAPGFVQPSQRKPQAPKPRQRRRKIIPGQQALEFTHPFTHPARSSNPADGVIYCDAPVAVPVHRAMAAALDASIVLMALAVFGVVFRLAGGVFVLNARTAPLFLGVATGVVLFYRLLWCLANGDTVGQKWTRLRLVDFDGKPPTRTQRLCRTASGFLSLMAGGIGLLWGLVDEDTLTWHDHISKTFPTPVLSRQ
jgi:uncharacterized RDD family membrane protein YckC